MAKKKKEAIEENIVDVDFSDELQTSMLDYSIETISRAIPDIRDGLKPVHRRILYTMYTEGNTHEKPYKKSVKSVGATLGRFHPHGDCLRADTRFYTLEGSVKTIKELYKTNEPTWVLGINKQGEIVPVLAHDFRIGQKTKKLYHVRFKNGFTITTTNQHQFRTIDGQWIKAEDLKADMEIDYAIIKDKRIKGYKTESTPIESLVADFFYPPTTERLVSTYIGHVNTNEMDCRPENVVLAKYGENEFELFFRISRNEELENHIKYINTKYKAKVEFEKLLINKKKNPTFIDNISSKYKSFVKKASSKVVGNTTPVIESVTIEHLESKENMYDFTVDGYENALVSASEDNTVFACVHNSSVYEAMVRLSQDFKMGIELVDLHGNGGSIDGDGAAAMRYTEARLSEASNYLLQDMEKGVVPFVDNFDGEEKEPVVLPAKFPNLLVNGISGLAVGMASDIPLHNLGEVIDAYVYYLDNPKCDTQDLMAHLKGPDYPTGGIITNKDDLYQMYQTGEGKVIMRAKTHIEKGDNGRTNIVVDEIPFTSSGNKQLLVSKMIDQVVDKTFPEIYSIEDETSKDGIRIVIEVKKGYDVENVLEKLFAKTPLQASQHYNFLVTCNKKPMIINLKQYFEYYFEFNKECVVKKYQYLLKKVYERREIVDGLIKAIDVLDVIIEIIRFHDSKESMMKCLMEGNIDGINFRTPSFKKIAKTLSFTERQAMSIRGIRLEQLSNLEYQKLVDEQEQLNKKEASYMAIIKNDKSVIKEIKKDLKDIKKKYAVPRKTEIANISSKKYVEVKQVEDYIIIIDKFYYIKAVLDTPANRAPEKLAGYRHQITANSEDKIGIFTDKGNLYQFKVSEMSVSKIADKGTPIENVTGLPSNENIIYINTMDTIRTKKMLFHTKDGFVKIVPGEEFVSVKKLTKSTKMDDGDEICMVAPVENNVDILCETEKGFCLKYSIEEISELKKNSKGVKSIDMMPNDKVSKVTLIDDEMYLKDKNLEKIPLKKRGRKGIKK